jgi:hypothetical protein
MITRVFCLFYTMTANPDEFSFMVRALQKRNQNMQNLGNTISQAINPDAEREKALAEKQKKDREETERKLAAARPLLLMRTMKDNKWDVITDLHQREIIDLWKSRNPGWNDREKVYRALLSNNTGSTDSYINNVIASTAQMTLPPRPGNNPVNDETFYDLIYPRAGAIVWWAELYNLDMINSPHWYRVVYGRSITQNASLVKQNIGNDMDENKWSFGVFALAGLAIITAVIRFI